MAIRDNEKNNFTDYPLIIIADKNVNKESILNYLNNGGIVLTEADFASHYFNLKKKSLFIDFINIANDDLFKIEGICDVKNNCEVIAESNHLENQDGNKVVYISQIGKGKIIVFPSRFFSLINDKRISRKNFFSPYTEKETNERVTLVSKGMITHFLKFALEDLYHFRNLPFVSLWNSPGETKNILCFRIDTDFGKPEDMNAFYTILDKYKIKASWFIETKSFENNISFFKKFKNQELALHCYRHKVFSSYRKNNSEIKKGLDLLRKNDIDSRGFAAPYGEWNDNLSKAVEDLQFFYSSEFGFAYDSLPLVPVTNKKISDTLQIPVHPISAGRLFWGGHNSETILKYFTYIIEQKISQQEPIIFYAHPSELKFGIFEKLFENILKYELTNFTMLEYAEWWRKRLSLKWNAFFENDRLSFENKTPDMNNVYVKVSFPGNKKNNYLFPIHNASLDKGIEIKSAEWKNTFHYNPKKLRRKTLRMFYHDILSRYRKLKQ